MSAHIEVIEQYLDDVAIGARSEGRSQRARGQYAREAILGNYQASLNETATYHRYFIQLRDGEGGWAESMAKLRAEKEAAETMLRHYIDRYGTAVIDDNS